MNTVPLVSSSLEPTPAEMRAIMEVTRAGWLALLAGLAMGVVQGAWLWFGWFPVPAALRDPLAKPRLRLIVAHVSLVIFGMVLVTAAALT